VTRPKRRDATIIVHGISFEAKHGWTAAERKVFRSFSVNLEIERDVAKAAASDSLKDTLDYRGLCELVVELGTASTYRLLEALAARIHDAVAARFPGARVMVEVRKLHPPCAGHPEYSAVRLGG
jgi:dihydroneopterin aldolase